MRARQKHFWEVKQWWSSGLFHLSAWTEPGATCEMLFLLCNFLLSLNPFLCNAFQVVFSWIAAEAKNASLWLCCRIQRCACFWPDFQRCWGCVDTAGGIRVHIFNKISLKKVEKISNSEKFSFWNNFADPGREVTLHGSIRPNLFVTRHVYF